MSYYWKGGVWQWAEDTSVLGRTFGHIGFAGYLRAKYNLIIYSAGQVTITLKVSII